MNEKLYFFNFNNREYLLTETQAKNFIIDSYFKNIGDKKDIAVKIIYDNTLCETVNLSLCCKDIFLNKKTIFFQKFRRNSRRKTIGDRKILNLVEIIL